MGKTHGVTLEGAARNYADAILALPAMQAWGADADAEAETGRIERFDLYE